jgi:hypothetical protein
VSSPRRFCVASDAARIAFQSDPSRASSSASLVDEETAMSGLPIVRRRPG